MRSNSTNYGVIPVSFPSAGSVNISQEQRTAAWVSILQSYPVAIEYTSSGQVSLYNALQNGSGTGFGRSHYAFDSYPRIFHATEVPIYLLKTAKNRDMAQNDMDWRVAA